MRRLLETLADYAELVAAGFALLLCAGLIGGAVLLDDGAGCPPGERLAIIGYMPIKIGQTAIAQPMYACR